MFIFTHLSYRLVNLSLSELDLTLTQLENEKVNVMHKKLHDMYIYEVRKIFVRKAKLELK